MAFLLATIVLSLLVAPSAANINLNVGEQEDGTNVVRDGICSILSCTSEGDLEMFNYFENLWGDLTDVSLNFGGSDEARTGLYDGTEDGSTRKLRGNN